MPGLLCSHKLGEDWVDPGTLALTRHRPSMPHGINSCQDKPQEELGFLIYYADKEAAFKRAATTWRKSHSHLRFIEHSFSTIDDLVWIFRLLANTAKKRKAVFFLGAMFVHSSPPNQDESSQKGGLHAAPFRPKTLGELRYKEEVLEPSGLDVDTASTTVLKKLDRLPWSSRGTLQLFGCLSGGSPEDARSIAGVLAKTQHITTIGETGKAYFSKSPDKYIPVTTTDNEIYLRAFNRNTNLVIGVLEGNLDGFAALGEAIPQRTFHPE